MRSVKGWPACAVSARRKFATYWMTSNTSDCFGTVPICAARMVATREVVVPVAGTLASGAAVMSARRVARTRVVDSKDVPKAARNRVVDSKDVRRAARNREVDSKDVRRAARNRVVDSKVVPKDVHKTAAVSVSPSPPVVTPAPTVAGNLGVNVSQFSLTGLTQPPHKGVGFSFFG